MVFEKTTVEPRINLGVFCIVNGVSLREKGEQRHAHKDNSVG